jgi:transposase
VGIYGANKLTNWLKELEENRFEGRTIEIMTWPAYSPDANPIETAWDEIKVLQVVFIPSCS